MSDAKEVTEAILARSVENVLDPCDDEAVARDAAAAVAIPEQDRADTRAALLNVIDEMLAVIQRFRERAT